MDTVYKVRRTLAQFSSEMAADFSSFAAVSCMTLAGVSGPDLPCKLTLLARLKSPY